MSQQVADNSTWTDRTFYIYAGGKLISEYEDAASNSYSAGTQPGGAGDEGLSTFLYQHSDHLTTRFTTENSGSVSNQQAHYPYGESWYAGGGADWSVERKFTSYLKDGETGAGQVHYAMYRQHGARIGRFHMADPVRGNIRNPQRLNRYSYVMGDPMNRFDPYGLDGNGWLDKIWGGLKKLFGGGTDSEGSGTPGGGGLPGGDVDFEAEDDDGEGAPGGFNGPDPAPPQGPTAPGDSPPWPCNCKWTDINCWFSALIFKCPPTPGCTEERWSTGVTGNHCAGATPPHQLVQQWACRGDDACCHEKQRAFIRECHDRGPGHVSLPTPALSGGRLGEQCCKSVDGADSSNAIPLRP
jgi:RHS repeat-associated protein